MTNEEARELLSDFAETASNAARIAVWAEAFLQEGGEPTWDAVKSVSDVADTLHSQATQVRKFRDQYEAIAPF
jgi:hypothetical protein